MSFCTFSKENSKLGKTFIDNQFVVNFLPDAPADAVKVYLYGLYLCQNSENLTSDVSILMLSLSRTLRAKITNLAFVNS